ncbi:hypothetical protein KY345_06960, partial [Candidatus Woesearchaeota archaeon]|nr:hypothetical protein [Candidatus Woesearchaeota archaeon]
FVALKVSRYPGEENRAVLEEELENSKELSDIIPNTLLYYSMVELKDYPEYPSFAMEIVNGYPILDINIDCFSASRFKGLLENKSVDQLASSLELAAAKGWYTRDLQYFVLLGDQRLKGKEYERGDIILFDFCSWRKEDSVRLDIDMHTSNLRKLIE